MIIIFLFNTRQTIATNLVVGTMEYRTLGNTGLKVSRLGFGIMTFRTIDQAIDLLETARNYGCNVCQYIFHIDISRY